MSKPTSIDLSLKAEAHPWTGKLLLIAGVLALGFLATSLASFFVSRGAIREGVTEQALALTGDSIYSEIQKDILRPVFISSLMASDTFVRDWLLSGEQEPERLARYLREIRTRYGTVSSFLVSEPTKKYYFGDGVLKVVHENEPRDVWYFRVRNQTAPYEINVDVDLANRDALTVFINYRVEDYKGQFLGVTGVGLAMESINRLLKDYEQRFARRIYFVDAAGNIALSGAGNMRGALADLPGREALAAQLKTPPLAPLQTRFEHDGETALVHARFLPELNWTLVVEQDMARAEAPLWHVFRLNLAISLAITALVIFITLTITRRAQAHLHQLATTDAVTGLQNRRALNIVFEQWCKEVTRVPRDLSAVLIDIDHFKRVNDLHGHLAGDAVLRAVGRALADQLRACDVVARWGGEEFMVLLRDCPPQDAARIAENLRVAVQHVRVQDVQQSLSISLGVATRYDDEHDTAFFARLDAALYAAKEKGRNRVEVAV